MVKLLNPLLVCVTLRLTNVACFVFPRQNVYLNVDYSGSKKYNHRFGENIRINYLHPLTTSGEEGVGLATLTLGSKKSEASEKERDSQFWVSLSSINQPYAIAYIFFIGYAVYRSFTETAGASSELLQEFAANPLNPGCNELFVTVFNLLGLYFIPLACLIIPGARDQKLPPTPFILGSMLGGYGLLGPYLITRKPTISPVSKSDLGWFTVNVLENKLFNFGVAAVFISSLITTGCINAFLSDPNKLVNSYLDLFNGTALASVSSLDLLILTLVASSLIPEDLSRRGVNNEIITSIVAASTALLPGVGVALYCAFRPDLED